MPSLTSRAQPAVVRNENVTYERVTIGSCTAHTPCQWPRSKYQDHGVLASMPQSSMRLYHNMTCKRTCLYHSSTDCIDNQAIKLTLLSSARCCTEATCTESRPDSTSLLPGGHHTILLGVGLLLLDDELVTSPYGSSHRARFRETVTRYLRCGRP
jgi:hypothetical protein